MVVLSDGADNYSWFDNSSSPSSRGHHQRRPLRHVRLGGGRYGRGRGRHPGPPQPDGPRPRSGLEVQDEQLQALANAGDGRYLKNPSASQVGALFDEVTREFATIQDHGATVPMQPGDYA